MTVVTKEMAKRESDEVITQLALALAKDGERDVSVLRQAIPYVAHNMFAVQFEDDGERAGYATKALGQLEMQRDQISMLNRIMGDKDDMPDELKDIGLLARNAIQCWIDGVVPPEPLGEEGKVPDGTDMCMYQCFVNVLPFTDAQTELTEGTILQVVRTKDFSEVFAYDVGADCKSFTPRTLNGTLPASVTGIATVTA